MSRTVDHAHQQGRLFDLLLPHVEAEDKMFSDAEFVYRVGQRFQTEWNKKQTLVDPNE
jgi:hypothetical protein